MPSRSRCTSISAISAPKRTVCCKAATVFSVPRAAPARCATISAETPKIGNTRKIHRKIKTKAARIKLPARRVFLLKIQRGLTGSACDFPQGASITDLLPKKNLFLVKLHYNDSFCINFPVFTGKPRKTALKSLYAFSEKSFKCRFCHIIQIS